MSNGYTAITYLEKDISDLAIRCIVLEEGDLFTANTEMQFRHFKVADYTGCIDAAIWFPDSEFVKQNDVIILKKAYTALWDDSLRLFSYTSPGWVSKVNGFKMLYNATNDISSRDKVGRQQSPSQAQQTMPRAEPKSIIVVHYSNPDPPSSAEKSAGGLATKPAGESTSGSATKPTEKSPNCSITKSARKSPRGAAAKAAGESPRGSATKAAEECPSDLATKVAVKSPRGATAKAAGDSPSGSITEPAGKSP